MIETNEEHVPFTAGDGRELRLRRVTGPAPATRPPVLLVHGAGVRSHIFQAPVDETIVDRLVAEGHEVWLEDWRASIDFEPNQWTLDQAAVHDHPAAVSTVAELSGSDEVKAIVHCQGSTSFLMSAVSGLVPQVSTIVANAVTLHPIVRRFSEIKINQVRPIVERMTDYLNPQWTKESEGFFPRAAARFVELSHRECDNLVCRLVSFTYGYGFPALWSHDNISDATHDWLRAEFAEVPLSFFRQMATSIDRGHLVSVEGNPALPRSFVAQPPRTDARIVLLAGEDNYCFLPESQIRTHEWLDGHAPGRHALHLFPGYGHLDIWMGDRAATDIFPTVVQELRA